MRSLTHFLRLIPTWTLTIPSATVNSLPPSLWFSLRGERENWKNNTFSAVEDSTLLWWHSGTQKRVGRAKERDQIDNEARPPWKSIVKTKNQSLTSVAFIILVPIALFLSLSRRGLGTRIEGLWRHTIFQSKILGLPVFMYAVVMFLYTVWEKKWRPSRQDSRNLFQALNGINLANVSVRKRWWRTLSF